MLKNLCAALGRARRRLFGPKPAPENLTAFLGAQSQGQFISSGPLLTPEYLTSLEVVIHDVDGMARHYGTNPNAAAVAREIYHLSEHGICVDELSNGRGFAFTGYCEGVDATFAPHTLFFPFTVGDMISAVAEAERESEEVWDETHGCGSCGPEDPETGYTPVNEYCIVCNGEGTVL